MEIDKRIPPAAGLGGGSSNAAAAIKGADSLYHLGLTEDEMLAAAAEVGSDVPFFILGGTALAKGRGERVKRLSPLPVFWVVLAKPPFSVSTGEIYRLYEGKKAQACTERFLYALQREDIKGMISAMGNDLEPVTIGLYPQIASVKERLLQLGAQAAVMAGSGPTVFGLFGSREQAMQAAAAVREKNEDLHLFVCRTIAGGEREGG